MTHAAAATLSSCVAAESDTGAILAAIKPHEANDAVLATAQWLAEHEHRALHIVSVIDTGSLISSVAAGAPATPPFHDEDDRRTVKRNLRAAYERTGFVASRLRIDVLEGPPAATIAYVARRRDVRMVVVGKGANGLLSHLLHGETVKEIIRHAHSPVLVVPEDPAVPIERAMVAFDFSTASVRAAVAAHELLGVGGRLTLVNVATPRRVTGRRGQWWLRSIERRTRATLGEFARALPPRTGVTVEMEKLHGDPVEILTAYAETHAMQLLACGWHEHALIERMFVASNTDALLHRAHCAVLVAPESRGAPSDDADDAGDPAA